MAKKYLRKRAVAERYNIDPRSVERLVADGRLPAPEYPVGRFPLWDEELLNQTDKAATVAPRKQYAERSERRRKAAASQI